MADYKRYYVNKNAQDAGEHEVHTEDCKHLPSTNNREYLGYFNNCQDAIKEAEKHYDNVDGCKYCCKPCHKK